MPVPCGVCIIERQKYCISKSGVTKQIRTIERNVEIPHEGAFCDLVWSDPEEIEVDAWAVSTRGAGYMFGHKAVSAVIPLTQAPPGRLEVLF
jgi:diadenosine tetraphosphatase ApaH/serine/threonine PP2A family protein phosphatase